MATAVRNGELIGKEIPVPDQRVEGCGPPSDPFALGLPLDRLTAPALADLHARWRKAPRPDAYTRLNYAENVRVRWNLHTNALEGSRVTYEDVSKIVVHRESVAGYTLREVAEVAGHNLALERMQALAATGAPLTETELKEWHRLLLGPDPAPLRDQYGNPHPVAAGLWKTGRNVIGLAGGGARPTAEPSNVPRLMDNFLRRLHSDLDHVAAGRRDLLDVLADTHSQFIEIHPFDDGNGRAGRLITSWQCLRGGARCHRVGVRTGSVLGGDEPGGGRPNRSVAHDPGRVFGPGTGLRHRCGGGSDRSDWGQPGGGSGAARAPARTGKRILPCR